MHNNKKALEEKLRLRGEAFQMPVDDKLWERVAADLPPKQKPIALLYFYTAAAAAALLLLLGFSWWLLFKPTPATNTTAMVEPAISSIERAETAHTLSKEQTSSLYTNALQAKQKQTTVSESEETQLVQMEPVVSEESDPVAPSVKTSKKTQEEPTSDRQNTLRQKELQEKIEVFSSLGNQVEEHFLAQSKKKKDQTGLTFSLGYGNQIVASNSRTSPPFQPAGLMLQKTSLEPETSTSNVLDISGLLTSNHKVFPAEDVFNSEPSNSKYKYKTPISFSLLVRKDLGSGPWAIETGLSYTRLESTETIRFGQITGSITELSIDYLGIPLRLTYRLFQNTRWNVYASVGGSVEKALSAREKISVPAESTIRSSSVSVHPLQWSLTTNLGVNYLLINKLSMFIEPGVQYHFDDGSPFQTIRKDKPFQFSGQVGLRFTL